MGPTCGAPRSVPSVRRPVGPPSGTTLAVLRGHVPLGRPAEPVAPRTGDGPRKPIEADALVRRPASLHLDCPAALRFDLRRPRLPPVGPRDPRRTIGAVKAPARVRVRPRDPRPTPHAAPSPPKRLAEQARLEVPPSDCRPTARSSPEARPRVHQGSRYDRGSGVLRRNCHSRGAAGRFASMLVGWLRVRPP